MTAMTLSRDVGARLVQAFESCLAPVPGRPGFFRAYRCPANVLTIGWGHTNHHAPSFDAAAVWSQSRCDAVFLADMAIFERHVTAQLRGAAVTQHQFDALVSWSFNTGGPATSSVWPAARRGDIEAVCQRLARWNKGGGRVLRGLVRRRAAECALYRGEVGESLRIAGVQRAQPVAHGAGRTRPRPPAATVARQAAGEGALVGTGIAGGGAALDGSSLALALGLAALLLAVVGAVLLRRKLARIVEDFA